MLCAAKSRRKAGTAGLGDIRGAEYPGALIGSWLVQTVRFVVLGWCAAALCLAPRMSPEAAGAASPPLFRCARHSMSAHGKRLCLTKGPKAARSWIGSGPSLSGWQCRGARRSEIKEEGRRSRPGGHSRSRVPRHSHPANQANETNQVTPYRLRSNWPRQTLRCVGRPVALKCRGAAAPGAMPSHSALCDKIGVVKEEPGKAFRL